MKMEIYRNYPIGNKVDLVERLLDRGALADATRKITRNRQPGKCCATGCFAPDAPRMVALPQSSRPRLASARDSTSEAAE
jgi:4-hydroxybutyryl-CoA dehydratase/vinylacetyl-CoA-Delta-isomerase